MNRNDMIKGLQCCSQGRNGADAECGSCPYIENTLECKETLAADALEYIQRSEEVRADLVERMDELLATVKDMPDVVRCCECIHSEAWYADKRLCSLWDEDGIDVFNDGFCNYGTRGEENG